MASLPRRLAGPSWDATGRARASGVDLVGVVSGVVSRGMLHARSRRTPSATTWADLAHTTAPVLNVITAVWRLFCCCFPGRPALLFFILLVSWVRTCGPDIIIVRTFMLLCVSAANAAARSCHFSCCCVSLPTRLLEVVTREHVHVCVCVRACMRACIRYAGNMQQLFVDIFLFLHSA